jgi:hypothetical protein
MFFKKPCVPHPTSIPSHQMTIPHFSKLQTIIPLGLLALTLAGPLHAANSVSYQGFTWTFSSDRPTGTFVNGEPYVIGPVTVTAISPAWNGSDNGSMVNPVAATRNGFTPRPDSSLLAAYRYDSTKNVATQLPRTLQPGDVLVSSKTVSSYPNYMEAIGVLTVLSTAPPAGSFRPGPYGTDRTVRFNKSQINWNILKNFASVSGAPGKAEIDALMPSLAWFEWGENFSGAFLMPIVNTAAGNAGNGLPSNYGREIARKWGLVGLWLNTNQPSADKERIAIQAIQCGIDIHSYVQNGGGFYHDGGHKCGRKLPLVMAAAMLNDATLKTLAANPNVFQEDTQTWIVTQSDVGRAVDAPNETYQQQDVGMGEWGVRHRYEPRKDDRRWTGGTPYRHVVWPSMGGPVLAAELMGLQSIWNHPGIFTYNSRYKSLSSMGSFVDNMWNYRGASSSPTLPPETPAPFAIGSRIEVFRNTNVRASGSLSGSLLGTQPTGVGGTLVEGPVLADGVTWWRVDYDSGADGWSGADNFIGGAPAQPTPPSAPSGLRVVGFN